MAAAVAGVAGAVAEVAGAAVAVVAGAGVVADVTARTAELAGAVTEVAVVVDGMTGCGEVAACACRENSSKTVRIPAAKIAACTARRAM